MTKNYGQSTKSQPEDNSQSSSHGCILLSECSPSSSRGNGTLPERGRSGVNSAVEQVVRTDHRRFVKVRNSDARTGLSRCTQRIPRVGS